MKINFLLVPKAFSQLDDRNKANSINVGLSLDQALYYVLYVFINYIHFIYLLYSYYYI